MRFHLQRTPNNRKSFACPGLTISELVVAITLSSLIMLALIPLLIHMMSMGGLYAAKGKQIVDVQTVVDSIEADIAIARLFHDRSMEDTDTPRSSSDNQWEARDSPGVLILEMPATTLPYPNPSRMLVFDADAGDCDASTLNYSPVPIYINMVYFVHENNLYKRTIPPPEFNSCNDTSLVQLKSCLPGDSCALQDILLAGNISKFEVKYFQDTQDSNPDSSVFENIGTGALQDTPYQGVEVVVESTVGVRDENITHSLTLRESLILQELE